MAGGTIERVPVKVIIGVDVGGTTTAAGLVSPDGQVVVEERAATHARGPGTAADTIVELIESVREKAARRGDGSAPRPRTCRSWPASRWRV